jgi:hypothetical protein
MNEFRITTPDEFVLGCCSQQSNKYRFEIGVNQPEAFQYAHSQDASECG